MGRPDLIVLGAGPAGLGAAERAAARGHRVVVLERDRHVGGAAGSREIGGVRVDLGSHRLHSAMEPAILARLTELLGEDLQRRPRRGRIRLAGRWLPFPLQPAALRALPPGFLARAGVDAATNWARRPRADTFAEVVRTGLGPTMLERFYGPYARKLWGLPPEEIAGDAARRRIGAGSAAGLARRLVRGRDPEARTFLYPRRGFGHLWEALADAAREHGAEIRLGAEVTGVATGPEGGRVRLAGGSALEAPTVFSTLPLPLLARLHDPAPPPDVSEDARALRSRAMVLVYLVFDVPAITSFDALYLPEPFTPLTRISEPRNYRDGHPGPDDPGDPPGRTVLCAELPCDPGDAWWDADDERLAAEVLRTLERIGVRTPPPTEVATHRLASAYPVQRPGDAQRLDRLESWAAQQPGLLTFGRQGLMVHDNSHHALTMAWAAVDALSSDGSLDAAAWSRAREGFRAHVVED